MKQSGLLLLLFLGACSLSPNNSWRDMVGGRTFYESAYDKSGTLTGDRVVLGSFSTDAKKFTMVGTRFELKSGAINKVLYESYPCELLTMVWKSGTANHALYEYSENSAEISLQFDNMSGIGGKATLNNGVGGLVQVNVYFSEF